MPDTLWLPYNATHKFNRKAQFKVVKNLKTPPHYLSKNMKHFKSNISKATDINILHKPLLKTQKGPIQKGQR